MKKRQDIFEAVMQERDRQIKKFGNQSDLTNLESLAIAGEEFGEIAQCVCKVSVPPIEGDSKNYGNEKLQEEIIQLITVLVAWSMRIKGETK